MKKSNVIVFALLAVWSVVMLALWYILGFNRIDSPTDLVASIVWWAVIAAAIVAVVVSENVRRRRIRTLYVGERSVFNSETGLVPLASGSSLPEVMAGMVESLQYTFDRKDFPTKGQFEPKCFVRTTEFKSDGAHRSAHGATTRTWKGEVVLVGKGGDARPFQSQEELAGILNALNAAAA